ncbi:MAG: FAD-dependent oxidoreductase [Candidatus Pacebacteria bacterium]|jgi:flavin-dependent dehydrogenase|nr:FAD-dependent oxidoreductase [Candidatus Paceibacterota bacterium]MDD3072389.1 FAD-dependent oxidoreductase [Candidatus Paceibacterota bacterium]MDD3729002.1 FAD-dependent oxidoreductase [Candidatus Paceibacterota bacterium]MDD4201627.1 FAD-dependent oxidoreductase [Candidatus Paceibacterota bacterium]MDD4467224.1 FAD-dependent oxidoreductase [Candidatus Paceibacterota bacterium]
MNKKIAIIGGGTIGLYLALKLIEKGNKVVLFEKRKEIGTDVCSGIFSEKIFKFIPESKNIVEKEIKSALLRFPKKTIHLLFKERFFLFSHSSLDKILYSKVKESVILGKEIKSIPQGFDRVIGCDGANSFIRKSLGLKKPKLKVGIRGFLKEKDSSDFVETWPLREGFVWKIPRKEVIEYGIMEKPEIAKKALALFLKKDKINLEEIDARIIPCGFSIPKKGKVTLCGDAAGITKPWSGGGVIWGLKSADILVETFPDFELYHKRMRKFFKRKIAFYNLMTKSVYFAGENIPFLIPKTVKIEPDFLL